MLTDIRQLSLLTRTSPTRLPLVSHTSQSRQPLVTHTSQTRLPLVTDTRLISPGVWYISPSNLTRIKVSVDDNLST